MYKNIGKKIRGLSIFYAWLGVLVSCTYGFIILFTKLDEYGITKCIVYAAIIIIGGSLLSWISSWLLYGFGRLIQNTSDINENLENILFSIEDRSSAARPQPQPAPRPQPVQNPAYDYEQDGNNNTVPDNNIPLESFKLPETREEMFKSQLRKIKTDYEMSRITYDEYEAAKKRIMEKYR